MTFVICSCDSTMFEDLVMFNPCIVGTPERFVMTYNDYFDLCDELKEEITFECKV